MRILPRTPRIVKRQRIKRSAGPGNEGCFDCPGKPEFAGLLHDLPAQAALQDRSNRTLLAVGDHSGQKGDLAEFSRTQHHLLSITKNYTARWHDGSRLHTKPPGTFSFVPVGGVLPHTRAETPYKTLLCILDPSLLRAVERELDRYPNGDLHFRANFHDLALS
jgi:hypothetical protein